MDDYGNDILKDYTPRPGNSFPPEFNWTGYVYYMLPEHVNINWWYSE